MAQPRHIGIIMDGNGRWARLRGRGRTFGHIKGARVAKKIITACAESGIEYLTLFAFSTENWLRPANEVTFLMGLLQRYLDREKDNLISQNIRFHCIGDLNKLPSQVKNTVQQTIRATENNTGLNLVFAISYGSRWEITEAVKSLAKQVAEGSINPDEIDESTINCHLSTYPFPDPDLIVRTSGEKRLSNFLMWQSAYAELYFTETLWPDFSKDELRLALKQFERRERRFGMVEKSYENALS